MAIDKYRKQIEEIRKQYPISYLNNEKGLCFEDPRDSSFVIILNDVGEETPESVYENEMKVTNFFLLRTT